tara:strand:- start:798 stop:1256 length:459 start_codon:yes stop_codon:yes gene_type:complete
MKNYLVCFLGFLLLVSCKTLDNKSSTDLTNDKAKIISINFNTTGGGDIQFKISPTNSEYKINIIRYRYTSASVEISISENTNTELHGLLSKIFSKEIDIRDEVYKPEDPTGTWTTVTVNYDTQEAVKITNVVVNNKLSVLYDYIENESKSIN